MTKYLIHSCPKRIYYVEHYLIPSMLEQDINRDDITIYNDENHDGNLESWLKSCEHLDDEGGTWHLQDDVLICRDFKERTEKYDDGIVCGFGSNLYDSLNKVGYKPIQSMWWSFPCIRIPNKLAKECVAWVREFIIGNPVYEGFWRAGVNDDWCFKQFVKDRYPKTIILNLSPTLVEHIDWLIGGGTGQKKRPDVCRSLNFEDDDLVKELQIKLRAEENKLIGRNQITIGQTVWSSGG